MLVKFHSDRINVANGDETPEDERPLARGRAAQACVHASTTVEKGHVIVVVVVVVRYTLFCAAEQAQYGRGCSEGKGIPEVHVLVPLDHG